MRAKEKEGRKKGTTGKEKATTLTVPYRPLPQSPPVNPLPSMYTSPPSTVLRPPTRIYILSECSKNACTAPSASYRTSESAHCISSKHRTLTPSLSSTFRFSGTSLTMRATSFAATARLVQAALSSALRGVLF